MVSENVCDLGHFEKVYTGVQGYSLESPIDCEQVKEIIPKTLTAQEVIQNYGPWIHLAYPPSHFLVNEGRWCGLGGGRKIYFFNPQDATLGFRIYTQAKVDKEGHLSEEKSFDTGQIEQDIRIAKRLSKRRYLRPILHPSCSAVKIDFSAKFYTEGRDEGCSLGMKGHQALLCERIFSPLIILQTSNPEHHEWVHYFWNLSKVKNLNFPIKKLWGESFVCENPRFNEKEFLRVKKKILLLCKYFPFYRSQRKAGKLLPDLKYTNVVYCTVKKRWFWVDFD